MGSGPGLQDHKQRTDGQHPDHRVALALQALRGGRGDEDWKLAKSGEALNFQVA